MIDLRHIAVWMTARMMSLVLRVAYAQVSWFSYSVTGSRQVDDTIDTNQWYSCDNCWLSWAKPEPKQSSNLVTRTACCDVDPTCRASPHRTELIVRLLRQWSYLAKSVNFNLRGKRTLTAQNFPTQDKTMISCPSAPFDCLDGRLHLPQSILYGLVKIDWPLHVASVVQGVLWSNLCRRRVLTSVTTHTWQMLCLSGSLKHAALPAHMIMQYSTSPMWQHNDRLSGSWRRFVCTESKISGIQNWEHKSIRMGQQR